MPRFFFHVRTFHARTGDRRAVDAEGAVLPDLAAARADALVAAHQILAERLKGGTSPDEITIEITDACGRLVDAVAVGIFVRVRFPLDGG